MAAEKSLQGCRRQTKGLRRNPPLSYLIQTCLSEVGALESYQAITSAQPTLPLAKRATNMSESE